MKAKLIKIRVSQKDVIADQKYLDSFLATHHILKVETAFVNDPEKENFWSVIVYYEEMKMYVNEAKPKKYSVENEELNPDEIKILDSLKFWRSEKANNQNLPAYFIATNKELLSIAKYKPIKKEELLDIKGFGKHKLENYGEEIIGILESV